MEEFTEPSTKNYGSRLIVNIFESVVVPVINTLTGEIEVLILGSTIDNQDIYPIVTKNDNNISIFELSERIIIDTIQNDGSVQFCANEIEIICSVDNSNPGLLGNYDDLPLVCEVVGYTNNCPNIGSTSGSDDWGNNGDNSNPSNNNGDTEGDGNGTSSSGGNTNGGTNTNNDPTIEETIEISFITEQILSNIVDCTDLTEPEINGYIPLTSDQSEFLSVLILENLEVYNQTNSGTIVSGVPFENIPSFEELEAVISNLEVNNFAELIEKISDYLLFYNQYGSTARGTKPNLVFALSCLAWSGLFDIELNLDMLNHIGTMTETERAIYNTLSAREKWGYAWSAAQAKATARDVYPNAEPRDCILLNGPGDAYRHALWSALSSWRIGEFLTEQLTTAHENRPPDPDVPFQELEIQKDLFNNNVGLEVTDISGAVNIKQAVLDAFHNGELRMISNREMQNGFCRATAASTLIIAN